MSLLIALHHQTRYVYSRPVQLLPQTVRLRPAPHCRTPVLSHSLTIEADGPAPFVNWQQDPFGTWQARHVFTAPTTSFTVTVDLVADWTVINPFDFFIEPSAELWPPRYAPALAADLTPYLATEPATPRLTRRLEQFRRSQLPEQSTIDTLVRLNRELHHEISYLIRLEPGVQTPEQTLTLASGSCRDSGWLLVMLLRHLGIPARFVSGYLIQLTPDQLSLDGPSGSAVDFTDLHAWCEAYVPGAGWIGLDPTSGLLAGEGHLPLAATPAPDSAAPISGALDYADIPDQPLTTDMQVRMSVQRLVETPRVTKPMTAEQIAAMDALGERVDHDLLRQDVRLTMGGEPTFVAIDDPDAEEWNTAALGPAKRARALELIDRLRRQLAPGAVVHTGQGKWYPGEPLPRWALSCWWRADGVPVWRDHRLLAQEQRPAGHGAREAERFVRNLCRRLDLPDDVAHPAYEDVWYHLWLEQSLPAMEDPLRTDLSDPVERQRLARLLSNDLGSVVGFAVPLTRIGATWISCRWRDLLRRGHLFLVPGDSPMGFRLPVGSIPIAPEHGAPLDPLAPRGPLPQFPGAQSRRATTPTSSPSPVRTTLCVEPRDGTLHVFLPPCWQADDWLDLIAAVEDTAAATALPVRIEGYLPPRDHRLRQFSVTPDPGVIEVNVPPCASWPELARLTEMLYDEARQTRLTSEKFLIDGRHVGTGGGNHITLGGPTPADSPFLRRPDVLRSLIGYWHNHPSLSYLFSGMFIGATSQAPRADEARTETIRELQIALDRLPDHAVCPPWLVDRVLRHLLIDATGNTHRAEFCIDKLYNPDSSTGRLGLVELRNFEMPPHPRMALAAHLLLRCQVARFWRQPYGHRAGERLARWGDQLHDRFLLPELVQQDFMEVLDDLAEQGYPLDPAWFAAQHDFRFPVLGRFQHRTIHVELRHALEPWNVLGEEAFGGGTARFVDSSVERLQVRVQGAPADRYQIAVNGVLAPLTPVGPDGTMIAGVRYRAWQPPSCLHPTIPVHAPLIVDLVDSWNGRAVAGCTYHVAHPGGRNHQQRPINGYEAEGRRLARFAVGGHTPGPLHPIDPGIDPGGPLTLDLRRVSDLPLP